ncbi:hypothetical protein AB0D86_01700 [Streptomyces sp. NPDC048324]
MLKEPPNIRREREEADSPVLLSLRERVRADYERRQQFGSLGRLL